jgi:hypothetical protein
MKEYEMGGSCGTNGKKRNGCRVFIGKPGGKMPLGSPRNRWVKAVVLQARTGP